MRTSRNLSIYYVLFLVFSTFTAAWPWPRWMPELDALIVRRDTSSSSSSSTDTTSATGSTNTASATNTADTSSNTNTASTASDTGSASATGTGKTSSTGTSKTTGTSKGSSTTKKPTTTSYDARLAAGGVSLITPSVAAGSQFYKIGDYVTFAWNYTSLSVTPTAVFIGATCTANKAMYTFAANQTTDTNNTQAFTWDTNAFQSAAIETPLLTETYTLVIRDVNVAVTAAASAGYLAVYDSYQFAMYTPQAYTPLGEFKCATCSGALSEGEKRAIKMVFGVGLVTVLSFTWFVGGTGIIW